MSELWRRAADRMRDELGQVGFETWIGPLNFVGHQGSTVTIEAPNRFFRDWVNDRYLGMMRSALSTEAGISDGGAADARCEYRRRAATTSGQRSCQWQRTHQRQWACQRQRSRQRQRRQDGRGSSCGKVRAGARRSPSEPEPTLHVCGVRGRLGKSVRACSGAGSRQPAGREVQPALHLRRSRSRQDAPGHRDRASHLGKRRSSAQSAVHAGRDFHERAHQLAPARQDGRIQGEISPGRRVDPRRRPVPCRPRAHPGRVLPYFQLAARRAASDHADLGQGAARNTGPRGAAAQPIRDRD